ncbi:MAG: STAS/SEC14 domain-containing protein [Proteobacteria bacterium]|nr:STAS/SEC14 domain-containing protein [Pseudomonadota bacterium]
MTESEILEVTFKEITTDNELFCQFDDHHGVLLLNVKNPFSADDFQTISSIINPYFTEHGELKGVIINSKKFPYWSGAKNRAEYLDFAGNNHHKFQKAALGMGGFFTKIVARIARGRVHPEIKIFKYNQIEKAQDWILQ